MNRIVRKFRNLWIAYVVHHDQTKRVKPWFAVNGDHTFRLNYDLNRNSIVFDLGGYKGQWASDIFAMYCSTIHVFEPASEFAKDLCNRFARNDKIHVHNFGLGARNEKVKFTLGSDSTSTFAHGQGDTTETVQLLRASDFIIENKIDKIDLIKINIEGGEFDLLEHLLDVGLIKQIRDIQIQFHSFVPHAEARMKAIQLRLSETHRSTYMFPFVWENWSLKV